MSAPEAKIPSDPAITTQRTSGSRPSRSTASCIAVAVAMSRTLRRSALVSVQERDVVAQGDVDERRAAHGSPTSPRWTSMISGITQLVERRSRPRTDSATSSERIIVSAGTDSLT